MTTHARVKYLRYEVQMLDETKRKLEPPALIDQITVNAFVESFCIHARNLNDFLLEKRNSHADLLKASSFTDAAYKPPRRTKRRTALFDKINQQISHLTTKRTAMARRKIGPKHRAAMFAILYADLKNFDHHLRPGTRGLG